MGKYLSVRGKVWLMIVLGCLIFWILLLLWGIA